MGTINLEDVWFVLLVVLVVGLREYVGLLCVSGSAGKACGTCGRCRRARPTGKSLA